MDIYFCFFWVNTWSRLAGLIIVFNVLRNCQCFPKVSVSFYNSSRSAVRGLVSTDFHQPLRSFVCFWDQASWFLFCPCGKHHDQKPPAEGFILAMVPERENPRWLRKHGSRQLKQEAGCSYLVTQEAESNLKMGRGFKHIHSHPPVAYFL